MLSKAPDRRYVIRGLCDDSDDIVELLATDRAVIFVSTNAFRVYALQDLQTLDAATDEGQFVTVEQSIVESVAFIPRSDDAIVAYRQPSTTDTLGAVTELCQN